MSKPQIYIKPAGLWCSVTKRHPNGRISFQVINGLWHGSILNGTVTVERGRTLPADDNVIAWEGDAPFCSSEYNEAIAWIEEQIGA